MGANWVWDVINWLEELGIIAIHGDFICLTLKGQVVSRLVKIHKYGLEEATEHYDSCEKYANDPRAFENCLWLRPGEYDRVRRILAL